MSDWRRALEDRKEELDAAHHHVEQAEDQFIEGDDARNLEQARDRIEEVINHTEEELALADADWYEVESHADEIMSLLDDCLEMLAEDGLIEYDADTFLIQPALDDEPEEIRRLRRFIEQTHSNWYEVRSSASENTSGGF